MGLDIYVGALSRYYPREWQNEVQQMMADPEARVTIDGIDYPASELQVTEVKSGTPAFAPANFPEALAAIEAWRSNIAQALEKPDFDWAEREESPYTTRKITWDCYSALLLWAAHEEHRDLPCPATPAGEMPDEDPALVRSRSDQNGSKYPHLLGGTEMWFAGTRESNLPLRRSGRSEARFRFRHSSIPGARRDQRPNLGPRHRRARRPVGCGSAAGRRIVAGGQRQVRPGGPPRAAASRRTGIGW